MRSLLVAFLFICTSFSAFGIEEIAQGDQGNHDDNIQAIEEAVEKDDKACEDQSECESEYVEHIEGAPQYLILKRIKRKSIRKQLNGIPPGPVLAFKIYYNDVSYENYLGLVIGKEAYFTLKYLLSSMQEDSINCKIKIWELLAHIGPLTKAEHIYAYFSKGAPMDNPKKDKCIACEDKACAVAGECGHMCLCEGCAEQLDPRKCPICRSAVTKFLRIYLR